VREAAIRYEAGKWPFLIEVKHLPRTRMIVSIEVPAHDADVGGNEAVEVTLGLFVANYDGLVQQNGKGFYARDRLLVGRR
jgi:hypothetical protein